MKLRTFFKLDNDVYRVSVYTEDWSQGDSLLMGKFGEPEIDIGGTFGDSDTFTLDTDLKKIMSDSPFAMGFDYRDDVDAESHARTWSATITSRITDAVLALRAQGDTFTGETVIGV